MALNAGSVYVDLGGKFNPAGFAAYERRLAKSTAATGSASKRMGVMMASAGVAVAVGLGKAVKIAADYEQSLNTMQAVSKATAAEMQKVSAKAKQLGADLSLPGTSAADAAVVMTELAKGGFTVAQSMDAAKGAILLANAAQIDGAEAAKIITKQINAFGLEASDAARVADVLAASANATSSEMPETAAALQMVSAVAKQAGMSLEETVGAIGMLTNAGIAGSDAGTSLKTMLMNLSKPTADAQFWMQKMGVDMYDAAGNFVGVRDAVKQYTAGLKELNPEQQDLAKKAIFGTDAIRSANIIFGQGAKRYDAMTAAMQSNGQAAELGKAKMKGFKGAVEGLKSTVETIAINMGEKLLPVLTDAGASLADFAGAAGDSGALEKFASTVADVIGTVGAAAGVIISAAVAFGKLAASIGLLDPSVLAVVGSMFAIFKLGQVSLISTAAVSLMSMGKAIAVVAGYVRSFGAAGGIYAITSGIGGLISKLSPLGVVAMTAGAAIGLLVNHKRKAAQMAHEAAAAEREHADAIRATQDAALAVVDSAAAEKSANEQQAAAQAKVNKLKREGKTDTAAYSDAQKELKAANVEQARASTAAADAAAKFASARKDQTAAAKKELEAVRKQVDMGSAQGRTAASIVRSGRAKDPNLSDWQREGVAKYEKLQAAAKKYTVSLAQQQIAEANIKRLQSGMPAITGKYADSVAELVANMKDVPDKTKADLIVNDRGALGKLATFEADLKAVDGMKAVPKILADDRQSKGKLLAAAKQLEMLGAKRAVAKILVADGDAKSKMNNLLNLKRQLSGSVQFGLNVVQRLIGKINLPKRAAGKRAGRSETALVGEAGSEYVIDGKTGSGYRVDAPMIAGLSSSEYVIPTEGRYRGRGRALLRAAAADLGISQYAKGRKGRGGAGYDQQQLENEIQILENRIGFREGEIEKFKDDKKKKSYRVKLSKEVSAFKSQLATRRRKLAAVKAYEAKQQAAAERASIAEGVEQLGVARSNQGMQSGALGRQERQLKLLISRDVAGQKKAKKGSRRSRELQQRIVDNRNRLEEVKKRKAELSATGSDGGENELKELENQQTNAGEVLATQIKIQGQIVEVRKRMLAAAVKTGDRAAIIDAAQNVKVAESEQANMQRQLQENAVALAEAQAAATKTLTDDIAAARERLKLSEGRLAEARATGDAGLIAAALATVTAGSEQLDSLIVEQEQQRIGLLEAQANATATVVDDIAAANQALAQARKQLAKAAAAGDVAGQTSAQNEINSLVSEIDELTRGSALALLKRDEAAAALTAAIDDDKLVQQKLKDYWTAELAAARTAGDVSRETAALTELKSVTDAVTQLADKVQAELSKFFDARREVLQTFGANLVSVGTTSKIMTNNFTNNFTEQNFTADQVSRSLIFDLSGIQ